MKPISFVTIIMCGLLGASIASLNGCPTCLAHLKTNDKPFFMRQISAQIAASQETIKARKAEAVKPKTEMLQTSTSIKR